MTILGITMNTVTMQPRLTCPGIAMGIVGFTPLCKSMQGCVWCLFVCAWVWVVCVCVCLSDCDCLRLWDRSLALNPECEIFRLEEAWRFPSGEGYLTDVLPPEEVPLTRHFPGFYAPVKLSVSHLQNCPITIILPKYYYHLLQSVPSKTSLYYEWSVHMDGFACTEIISSFV